MGAAKAASTLWKGVKKGADEAATARKAVTNPPANVAGKTRSAENRLAQGWEEYQATQAKIDLEHQAGTPLEEVDDVLAAEEAATAQKRRQEGLFDPESSIVGNTHQTDSPLEFQERFNQQLTDEGFAARSILEMGATDDIDEIRIAIDAGVAIDSEVGFANLVDNIRSSKIAHKKNVDGILNPLRKDTRWKSATDEWFGDSPYKDDVQFHTDRLTDPSRPDSFVQFDDPWEIGVHSGTNNAAEGVIGRGGIDEMIKNRAEQSEAMIMVAAELGIPVKEVQSTMAQALNRHYLQRFTKNGDINIWEDARAMLDAFAESFGARQGQAGQFIAGLRGMPTPSTTPFLFRGRNGLLLKDDGGFKVGQVARQLEDIFNNEVDQDVIAAAMSAGNDADRTRALTRFMEDKGYDHIVYHNSVEDRGSLSIINWNPDLMASPWDRQFNRSASAQAKVASQYVMGALGLGVGADATIRDQE